MSEIKWSYDESNGSFSALPASPLLLPSILFLCLVAPLFRAKYEAEKTYAKPRPIDPKLYEQYKKEYLNLMDKKQTQELTLRERVRLQDLQNPPWKLPGETWHYS